MLRVLWPRRPSPELIWQTANLRTEVSATPVPPGAVVPVALSGVIPSDGSILTRNAGRGPKDEVEHAE